LPGHAKAAMKKTCQEKGRESHKEKEEGRVGPTVVEVIVSCRRQERALGGEGGKDRREGGLNR